MTFTTKSNQTAQIEIVTANHLSANISSNRCRCKIHKSTAVVRSFAIHFKLQVLLLVRYFVRYANGIQIITARTRS